MFCATRYHAKKVGLNVLQGKLSSHCSGRRKKLSQCTIDLLRSFVAQIRSKEPGADLRALEGESPAGRMLRLHLEHPAIELRWPLNPEVLTEDVVDAELKGE